MNYNVYVVLKRLEEIERENRPIQSNHDSKSKSDI